MTLSLSKAEINATDWNYNINEQNRTPEVIAALNRIHCKCSARRLPSCAGVRFNYCARQTRIEFRSYTQYRLRLVSYRIVSFSDFIAPLTIGAFPATLELAIINSPNKRSHAKCKHLREIYFRLSIVVCHRRSWFYDFRLMWSISTVNDNKKMFFCRFLT